MSSFARTAIELGFRYLFGSEADKSATPDLSNPLFVLDGEAAYFEKGDTAFSGMIAMGHHSIVIAVSDAALERQLAINLSVKNSIGGIARLIRDHGFDKNASVAVYFNDRDSDHAYGVHDLLQSLGYRPQLNRYRHFNPIVGFFPHTGIMGDDIDFIEDERNIGVFFNYREIVERFARLETLVWALAGHVGDKTAIMDYAKVHRRFAEAEAGADIPLKPALMLSVPREELYHAVAAEYAPPPMSSRPPPPHTPVASIVPLR